MTGRKRKSRNRGPSGGEAEGVLLSPLLLELQSSRAPGAPSRWGFQFPSHPPIRPSPSAGSWHLSRPRPGAGDMGESGQDEGLEEDRTGRGRERATGGVKWDSLVGRGRPLLLVGVKGSASTNRWPWPVLPGSSRSGNRVREQEGALCQTLPWVEVGGRRAFSLVSEGDKG